MATKLGPTSREKITFSSFDSAVKVINSENDVDLLG